MSTDQKPFQQFYTPSSIMQIFNAATITNHEKKMVLVKGIFKKTGNSNYNGFYYNLLKDEATEYAINLKTPELLHNQLLDNKTIEFTGFITRRIEAKGRIEVRITLIELIKQSINSYSDEDLKRFELLNDKLSKGFKDIDRFIKSSIIKNQSIAIKIISGKSGIIDEDIRNALGNSAPLFQLHFQKLSLNSTTEIIDALNKDDAYPIICVARGGVENLEIFESVEICEHLLFHKKIIASAIGHAENKTLFEKMSDGKFATPASFGHYLKDLYKETLKELDQNRMLYKESTVNTVKHEYEKVISDLKISLKDLEFQTSENDVLIKNIRNRSLTDQKQIDQLTKKQMIGFWLMLIAVIAAFLTGQLFF